MTSYKQALAANRAATGYIELTPNNYEQRLLGYESVDLMQDARSIVHDALNKPGLMDRVKIGRVVPAEDTDPTSCFTRPDELVLPTIKAIAAVVFGDYYHRRMGYINMGELSEDGALTDATVSRLETMGLIAPAGREITLVAVAARTNSDALQQERAAEVYNALQHLPPSAYRVAVLGPSLGRLSTAAQA